MNMNDYQEEAGKYAQYRHEFYPPLGLAEEAGEFCGVIAKSLRKHGYIHSECIDKAAKELGDVLWQVQQNAREMGLTLEQIATMNLEKLNDRQARGVIQGSGDDR